MEGKGGSLFTQYYACEKIINLELSFDYILLPFSSYVLRYFFSQSFTRAVVMITFQENFLWRTERVRWIASKKNSYIISSLLDMKFCVFYYCQSKQDGALRRRSACFSAYSLSSKLCCNKLRDLICPISYKYPTSENAKICLGWRFTNLHEQITQ